MNRSVVTQQRTAWWRSHRATSRCTAGRVWCRGVGRGEKRVASATLSLATASLPLLQPDQKAVRQHDRHRMAMKPRPQPPLVLVPAQLTRGLFMKLLNGMALVGVPRQLFRRGLRGQIAPKISPLFRLALCGTLAQQPALMPRPGTGDSPTSQRHELLAQPPCGPPPPANRAPLPAGHALEQFIRPPYGRAHCVPHTHGEIRADRHHIGRLPGFQARQKVGVVAVVRIGHDTAMRHPPRPRLIKERQGDRRLGLEGNLLRHPCLLPPRGIIGPRLRQIQPYGHRPGGPGVGIAARDRNLTIADLAQGARILPRDPHRSGASLEKAGLIEYQDAVARGGLGDHLLHPLPVQVFLIPIHLGEELLQPLGSGAWHCLGDGVAIL
jgi:hypothetical protein